MEISETNKEIINSLIDSYPLGFIELGDLSEDIKIYITKCREKGYLIKL